MKINFYILLATFLSLVFFSCGEGTLSSRSGSAVTLTPEAYADKLEFYLDSIKDHALMWNTEYQKVSGDTLISRGVLTARREAFEQFLSRASDSIRQLPESGKFSRELKAVYLEFLKEQKLTIEKVLKPLEGNIVPDHLSEDQKRLMFETRAARNMDEQNAMINIHNFRKLYYEENGLSLPGADTRQTTDSVVNSGELNN